MIHNRPCPKCTKTARVADSEIYCCYCGLRGPYNATVLTRDAWIDLTPEDHAEIAKMVTRIVRERLLKERKGEK